MINMKKISMLFAMILMVASCSVSTANITDVKMCLSLQDDLCQDDVAVFENTVPEIYVSAILNNAPEGTKVFFTWNYLEDGTLEIASVDVVTEETTSNLHSYLTIPDNGWPQGKYEVVIKVDADNVDPIHKEFSVQ